MGNLIITISMAAVAVVLVLGLINMMRGGSPNRSQSLMRWRVGLQFATLLIVLVVLWLRG